MNAIKLLDYQIIVSLMMSFTAWKCGDWQNWKKYYPTILYLIVGQFLYEILCYNYPLWSFESPLLKVTFSGILIAFVFYPSTVLIYLPHMPSSGMIKQILYVLLWVVIFSVTEEMSLLLGFFSHHNGWNIWLSILFNCVMFPLLWLHYKKPLWACAVLAVCAAIGITLFQVPLSSMK